MDTSNKGIESAMQVDFSTDTIHLIMVCGCSCTSIFNNSTWVAEPLQITVHIGMQFIDSPSLGALLTVQSKTAAVRAMLAMVTEQMKSNFAVLYTCNSKMRKQDKLKMILGQGLYTATGRSLRLWAAMHTQFQSQTVMGHGQTAYTRKTYLFRSSEQSKQEQTRFPNSRTALIAKQVSGDVKVSVLPSIMPQSLGHHL